MNLGLMSELVETTSHAANCFLKSEMALNDGDVELCQKYSKEGQSLVKTLKNDTFLEVEEEFGENAEGVNDYDYPNNMELIKALNEVVMAAGSILGLEDDNIKRIVTKTLYKAINTAKEIFEQLFENWGVLW